MIPWEQRNGTLVDREFVGSKKYYGPLTQVNKPDHNADLLAERLNGVSRLKFESHDREFDAISDLFIAQTKPAMKRPSSTFRNQAKGTFEAAVEANKIPYFHFEGMPSDSVIKELIKYRNLYKKGLIIDIKSLK